MKPRHFLSLRDLSSAELNGIIKRAIALKSLQKEGVIYEPLKNKVLGMVFEKSSTRTRVSFETGIIQLGGQAIFLSPRDTQLGRGEPIEDSARVLSSMVDIIMVRTFEHSKIEKFAQYSSVPVINALTDLCHPCQLLADIQTFVEHRGDIKGKTVAWIGDGNNMCNSYINAAIQFDFQLSIASPQNFEPSKKMLNRSKKHVHLAATPEAAATGADLIVTDVWASMGQEHEQTERIKLFRTYQVDETIMRLAKPDALFMHCLPAHRGEEVSDNVIDGAQSVVWDEAENRLHSQKALLEFLMGINYE